MLLPTRNPKDMGLWHWVRINVLMWVASVRRQYKNECICGTLSGTAAHWLCEPFTCIHTLTMSHQHSWVLTQPPLFFPHSFLSPYAYHSITLSTASVSSYPGRTSAAAHPCDQPHCCPDVCSALFQQGKKPHGDSLGDRLITAFHQSPLRLPPLQLEADRSPLFPFLPYLSFFRSF